MGYSIGDGLVVMALAAAFLGYGYLKYAERRRRLDLAHRERMAAMDKGIPLPELPVDPPRADRPPDPKATLLHGIVWLALGVGAMLALAFGASVVGVPRVGGPHMSFWPFPLPVVFLGLGLILFYFLVAGRR